MRVCPWPSACCGDTTAFCLVAHLCREKDCRLHTHGVQAATWPNKIQQLMLHRTLQKIALNSRCSSETQDTYVYVRATVAYE